MKKYIALLFLPLGAWARRPGAFNNDLLYIYLALIAFFVLIFYTGKAIKIIKNVLHHKKGHHG